MKTLIVNADDYGRAASVSAGIREAHLRGIVTSTTAMMNMPNMAAELLSAQRLCPRLGLGVHLTLTAERPLLPPEQLPSLMALSETGRFPNLAQFRAGAVTLNLTEVAAEWRAQIEKFQQITQQAPTHLDSHHHTSYYTPALFEAMLKLVRDYHCAIRLPDSSINVDADPTGHYLALAADIRHPDFFEVRFYDAGATLENLLEILEYLPDGVTELMCHPGLPNAGLAQVTVYNHQRAIEFQALTDERVLNRVSELGIALKSFHHLETTWTN